MSKKQQKELLSLAALHLVNRPVHRHSGTRLMARHGLLDSIVRMSFMGLTVKQIFKTLKQSGIIFCCGHWTADGANLTKLYLVRTKVNGKIVNSPNNLTESTLVQYITASIAEVR